MKTRPLLFHPAVVLVLAAAATTAFVLLLINNPRFAGPGRAILLYYHAPIGFAFTVYALDRLERRAVLVGRQWLVEAPVVALALSRTVAPLPLFSGHALFLSYVIAVPARSLARWVAALVLVDVIFFKVFLLHDPTLIGGVIIGLIAAALVRRINALTNFGNNKDRAMSPLRLETERLVIRGFEPADLPVIHRILDETLGDGSRVNDPATLARHRSWLEWSILNEKWLEAMYQPPYGDRAIVLRATGAVIGAIGYVPQLMPFEQVPELGGAADPASARYTPEFGMFWTMDPAHQRRGYTSEAARAMIAHAFQALRLKRIQATTDFDNVASQGVMRAVGMRLARNPWPEPRWFQVIGVLDNPAHE